MEEIWKPWIKNPRYLVSNLGRVKGITGVILATCLDDGGYLTISVRLFPGGPAKRTRVHRMVLETFCPIENNNNFIVDHINGIRTDNKLTNLRWATKAENEQYKNQNRKDINNYVNELIIKYGYEIATEKIKSLL